MILEAVGALFGLFVLYAIATMRITLFRVILVAAAIATYYIVIYIEQIKVY